ncbi:adenylyltransferase/cytidyltransferase family protein [Candidatus Micrarchaeota archaeon]|nr:adenylyltransferase/cytidyltransferase family protein [Candidatus Micrarchaeota archaeon]
MENIKKLLILQFKKDGINKKEYLELNEKEKRFLEIKKSKYYVKEKYRKKIKVVMTGGVFDILHYGHIKMLEKAKKCGDLLVVVLANDKNVKKYKNITPFHNEKQRCSILECLNLVDVVIVGKDNREDSLKRINPDVLVYGYDQKTFITHTKTVKFKCKEKGFNSSQMRDAINNKEYKC